MKPTNRQVLELNRALQLLEAQPGTDGGVKPTGYAFGKASYAIAKNMRKAGVIAADLESARQKLIAPLIEQVKARSVPVEGVTSVAGLSPGDPEHAEFVTMWTAILGEESDFEAHQITVDDLNLEKNSIPPSLINALALILKE